MMTLEDSSNTTSTPLPPNFPLTIAHPSELKNVISATPTTNNSATTTTTTTLTATLSTIPWKEIQLQRISPPLGSRLTIWQNIYVWFANTQQSGITNIEMELIRKLSNGFTWLDLIPQEWKDFYSAIYNESDIIAIEQKEANKIDKDVYRTYTLFIRNAKYLKYQFPEDMTDYYVSLAKVLELVSINRGYCQGINFIAAEILLELANIKDAYIVLAYLLSNCQLEILFDNRYSALFDYMRIFEKKLRKYNPKLYKHFKKYDYRSASYAIEMFTTMFVVTSPGELSLCLIDLILGDVNDILIKTGLSLLTALQPRLLRLNFEELHENFKDYALRVDVVIVIVQALKIQFQENNSVIKMMVKKIETLDPSSHGDLQFGKNKSKPPLPPPPAQKNNKKPTKGGSATKSRSSGSKRSISDETLSDEFFEDDEDDIPDNIAQLHKEMHLPLKAPESKDNRVSTDERKSESKESTPRNKHRLSRLAIKIAPKQLNRWGLQKKKKSKSPREGDQLDPQKATNLGETETASSDIPPTPDKNNKKTKDKLILIPPSPSQAGTSPPEVIAKSPSWWKWSWRAKSNDLESPSSKQIQPLSREDSGNQKKNDVKLSPTSSSRPQSYQRSLTMSSSVDDNIPAYLATKFKVGEIGNFKNAEEEEETIKKFYLSNPLDCLVLTHYVPPEEGLEGILQKSKCAQSALSILIHNNSHNEDKKGEQKLNEYLSPSRRQLFNEHSNEPIIPVHMKPQPTPVRKYPTWKLDDEKIIHHSPTISKHNEVDLIGVTVGDINCAVPQYIDQGGEVIPLTFHQTNHLIQEVLLYSLKENYFNDVGEGNKHRRRKSTAKRNSLPRKKTSSTTSQVRKKKNRQTKVKNYHLVEDEDNYEDEIDSGHFTEKFALYK